MVYFVLVLLIYAFNLTYRRNSFETKSLIKGTNEVLPPLTLVVETIQHFSDRRYLYFFRQIYSHKTLRLLVINSYVDALRAYFYCSLVVAAFKNYFIPLGHKS